MADESPAPLLPLELAPNFVKLRMERKMKDRAQRIVDMANKFNVFGPANILGGQFQKALLVKALSASQRNQLSPVELQYLRPVLAQAKICEAMIPYLGVYEPFYDENLTIPERVLTRTVLALKAAEVLASCGSMNCNIAFLVFATAIRNQICHPVVLCTFSGVTLDDRDSQHMFVILCSSGESYDLICDAYHDEIYPFFEGLQGGANTRLLRYHDVESGKQPFLRKFITVNNCEELYRNNSEVKALINKIFAMKEAFATSTMSVDITTQHEAIVAAQGS
jgi:hypothetical protein